MRSTSPEGVVVRDLPPEDLVAAAQGGDLRNGAWTRLGNGGSLGDPVTESLLQRIADRSHHAARAQGYAVGWSEGRRLAMSNAEDEIERVRRLGEEQRAARAAQHAAALSALDRATTQIEELLGEAVRGIAEQTVHLALGIAEAILDRELVTAVDPGADAVRRALAQVGTAVTATVRMNPADRAALAPDAVDAARVNVVDDPTLARGDAVLETEEHVVDATISAAIARVREVLTR